VTRAVFFSYAHEDRDWVSYVAGNIASASFNPFFDRDIVGGQQWWDRLLSEIEKCDVFAPVLSAAYLRSVPCRIEVSYALELGKTLIPLDLSGGTLSPTVFIEPIKAAQWISRDAQDPTAMVMRLIGALNNAPVAPPLPIDRQRPPAPGADVLATAVRLVGSPQELSPTEQWAVVGSSGRT
jgi:serine/threonine kinase PknH